ncbi:MAG: HAMP domain-containing protein, partial [Bacteriovorax sp.]|nr:HAMP domain-containing protein [Bacteriovorax sp.]
MRYYLSIKYKLILILTLIVIVTLLGYYLLATKLFEEDKIAYVYSSILEQVSSREHEIDTSIKYQSEMLTDYEQFLSLGNDQNLVKILENKKNILYFSCSKFQFKYGDQGASAELFTRPGNLSFDIKNKNILIKKEFPENDKCEFLIKATQLFEIKESIENSVSFFLPTVTAEGVNESGLIKEIRKKIIEKKLHSGVKEVIDNNKAYLLSFTQINNDLYYISGIPKNIAIAGIIELKEKSFFYFIALVSVVGIFSIVIASKFSSPIIELTEKVLLFGDGKFDVRSKVATRDELGKMALVFNDMASKISHLVEEVLVYSTQLEGLIKQRTAALKKALGLQNAMINSLEQGFFMVSNKLIVMGTYSKSAQRIFGEELEGKGVEKVLTFKQIDEATTKSLFKNMFSEVVPFESILGLAPKLLHTEDGRAIYLEYEPVRNKDEKIIGIVVIATDRTESIRLEYEAELDKSRVAMILKIVSNQYSFTKLLGEVNSHVDHIRGLNESELTKEESFRFAHTMKGCFLLFHLRGLALKIHAIEDEIKVIENQEKLNIVTSKLCSVIDEDLNSMALEYPFLFGGTNWKESRPLKSFLESDLIDLISELKNNQIPNIEEFLTNRLLFVTFDEMITPLKEDVILHAQKIGKKLESVEILGGDIRVNPADFSVHLQYLLHISRNSIDHGIEMPEVRQAHGKNEEGHVVVELNTEDKRFYC